MYTHPLDRLLAAGIWLFSLFLSLMSKPPLLSVRAI